jgi:hypothetical protein
VFKTVKRGVRVLEENYAACIRWVCSINPKYIEDLERGATIYTLLDFGEKNLQKAEAWKDKINAMKAVLGLTENHLRRIYGRVLKRTLEEIRAEIKVSGKRKGG